MYGTDGKINTVKEYLLGIVSELSSLLRCDTCSCMCVSVEHIYVFCYVIFYTLQWPKIIIVNLHY